MYKYGTLFRTCTLIVPYLYILTTGNHCPRGRKKELEVVAGQEKSLQEKVQMPPRIAGARGRGSGLTRKGNIMRRADTFSACDASRVACARTLIAKMIG